MRSIYHYSKIRGEIMSPLHDSKLLDIAREYKTSEEFKAGNFAKYSICRAKGLLREAFPEKWVQTPVMKERLAKVASKLPDDASLRDAIDDLMVTYRNIPTKVGKHRKITVNRALRDLELLLKNY